MKRLAMAKRTLTSLLLIIVGLPALALGGIPYFFLIATLLGVAAWEYVQMFWVVGYRPARWVTVGGTLALLVTRSFLAEYAIPLFGILILGAMAFHLAEYEKGRDQAPIDFAITIGGLAYLGWVGSYLTLLRSLENGAWWVFLVLPAVWLTDTGAYMIGVRYGKHKMTPRLSPKKSWEGYWAGAFTGMLGGGFLAFAYSTWGPLEVNAWQGAALGLLLGLLTPLGDLGESMFKRQAHIKDSGNLIPGHGGAFDRIDSWLWGAILGYYFLVWFVL
jgi:phosphatidate cytidylyltransferase